MGGGKVPNDNRLVKARLTLLRYYNLLYRARSIIDGVTRFNY